MTLSLGVAGPDGQVLCLVVLSPVSLCPRIQSMRTTEGQDMHGHSGTNTSRASSAEANENCDDDRESRRRISVHRAAFYISCRTEAVLTWNCSDDEVVVTIFSVFWLLPMPFFWMMESCCCCCCICCFVISCNLLTCVCVCAYACVSCLMIIAVRLSMLSV